MPESPYHPSMGGARQQGAFNPWAYMSPEERLAAEQHMIDQGGGEANKLIPYTDPRRLSPYDPMAMQQGRYEDMVQGIEGGIEENVVNPLGAAGYPNLAGALGAGASAGTEMFVPGPNEGIPFLGAGLGMAVPPPKKIESIMDFMTPEAREMAEARTKQMREDMGYEPEDPTKVVPDPYAAEADYGSPYADMMKKAEDLDARVLDPDTGLPIERKAPVETQTSISKFPDTTSIDPMMRPVKSSFDGVPYSPSKADIESGDFYELYDRKAKIKRKLNKRSPEVQYLDHTWGDNWHDLDFMDHDDAFDLIDEATDVARKNYEGEKLKLNDDDWGLIKGDDEWRYISFIEGDRLNLPLIFDDVHNRWPVGSRRELAGQIEDMFNKDSITAREAIANSISINQPHLNKEDILDSDLIDFIMVDMKKRYNRGASKLPADMGHWNNDDGVYLHEFLEELGMAE